MEGSAQAEPSVLVDFAPIEQNEFRLPHLPAPGTIGSTGRFTLTYLKSLPHLIN
jgi:hypothetical protein